MPFLGTILLFAFGAIFLYTGFRGIQGKEIAVIANRGGGLKRVAGDEARIMGWVYIVLGAFVIGIVVRTF